MSPRTVVKKKPHRTLTNGDLAQLLADRAADALPPLNRAFRGAARKAILWPVEAAELLAARRPLAELDGVGPYLAQEIRQWLEAPPAPVETPPIRSGFRTFTQAEKILQKKPQWLRGIRGDLQMHSVWSDGGGTIAEMAAAALERGYEYIAITDHSKGLKIAGGIDEIKLRAQGKEIAGVNADLAKRGAALRVMRSIEVNLSPRGEVDMDAAALGELDVVLGCFHSSLRKTEDQTERYLAALRNPAIQILGHPRGRIYDYRMGLSADWRRVFDEAAKLDKGCGDRWVSGPAGLEPGFIADCEARRVPHLAWHGFTRAVAIAIYGVFGGVRAGRGNSCFADIELPEAASSSWIGCGPVRAR